MPEFHLDHGTPEAARTFASLDSFTQGYIEAMFFTSASDPDDGDLDGATFAELAPESLAKCIKDCESFQTANAALLEMAYNHAALNYDAERAGNDYWYTRNGHGTGFWDRGFADIHGVGNIGDKLADAVRYSTVDLYRGDDGQIYLG